MRYLKKIILILFLCSCQNTKITNLHYCKACLDKENGILVIINEPQFTFSQEEDLRELMREIFRKEGFERFSFLDELEYELLSNGIKDLNDPAQLAKVHFNLNYQYLLKPTLRKVIDKGGIDTQDSEEANALYPVYRPPLTVGAVVRFELIETESGVRLGGIDVSTETSEKSYSESDGDVVSFNFSDVYGNARTSFVRGSKYMISDCTCPKGKFVKWSKIWKHL